MYTQDFRPSLSVKRKPKKPAVTHANPPAKCDCCPRRITTVFYDMKTKQGAWANLCPPCALDGPGNGKCGEGLGQKYILHNGKFLKVEG